LFDQQTRLVECRFCFSRGLTLDGHYRVCESDLELDLLATQRGRPW